MKFLALLIVSISTLKAQSYGEYDLKEHQASYYGKNPFEDYRPSSCRHIPGIE
jgi:hypothetical protein